MALSGYFFIFKNSVAALLIVISVQSNAESILSNIEKQSLQASRTLNIPEKYFLNISVNGTILNGFFYIEKFKDGRLILISGAWVDANLILSGEKFQMANGKFGYDLNSVKGLSFLLNTENQSIKISAPSESFGMTDLTDTAEPLNLKFTSLFGAYINYNVTSTFANAQGGRSTAAFLEGVLFNSYGSFVSGMVASVSDTQNRSIRADTYFQKDNPSRMEKITIGDAISSAGAWSRPVRFGGIAWSTDFALRPGFVSSATPSINGSAALPSTVEVLIDNQRKQTTTVNSGPFQIKNMPSVNGAGKINVIVKDILGTETITTQDFYSTPRLLSNGLSEFAFEAGLLRMNYGTVSNAYESPMLAATYRHGLEGFTLEGRSEVQSSRVAAGVDLAVNIKNLAFFHASVASSKTDGGLGFRQAIGFERSSKKMNISIQAENIDQSFVPFGALSTEAKPHKKLMLGLGTNLYKNLSASANIISQSSWNENIFKFAVINLSIPVYKDISLNTYWNKNIGDVDKYALGLNVIFPLFNGKSVAISNYSDAKGEIYGNVDYTQSINNDNDVSYRLTTSNDPSLSLRASVSANTPFNNINLDASQTQESASLRLNMSGSLGLLVGLPFASPYIGKGSFAVVKVAEEENVDIYQSNRKTSKTNRHGLALVTNLAPYEKNIISINAEDLAFDLEINETSQVLAPYARSGSFINFNIKKTNNRLVRLQTPGGIAILAGTKVRVLPGNNNFVVGKRGEVYLKDLDSENSILVPLPNGNCTATVSAPPSSKDKGLRIIAVCF